MIRRVVPLALLSCFLPLGAQAKTQIVVLPVVPLSGESLDPGVGGEISAAIEAELNLLEGVGAIQGEVPRKSRLKPPSRRRASRGTQKGYRRGMKRLSKGERYSAKLRFKKAIPMLNKGIADLERNIARVEDYPRLVRAHMLLAVAFFRRGKEAKGVVILEKVLRLKPGLTVEASEYPPLFLRAFERARERHLARETGQIRVPSLGEKAEVFLNGEALGSAPLVIEGVFPGENHLVVRKGGRRFGEIVDVQSGQSVTVTGGGGNSAGGAESLWDKMSANRLDLGARRDALALGKKARAEYVLLLSMASKYGVVRVGGFLGHVPTGRFGRLQELELDVDMLSVSVEAEGMAENVASLQLNWGAKLGAEAQPFISGRPLREAGAGASESEVRTVAFYGEAEADKPAVVAHRDPPAELSPPSPRAPIRTSREVNVVAVSPVALAPVEAARRPIAARPSEPEPQAAVLSAPAARRPIAARPSEPEPQAAVLSAPVARRPIAARPSEPEPQAAVLSAPAARRAPLTRATAGPRKEAPPAARGPVVGSGGRQAVGELGGSDLGGEQLIKRREWRPASSLVLRDLEAEAVVGGSSSNGWVWAGLGVGAAVVAGSLSWYFLSRDVQPLSVTVSAEW